MKKNLLVSACLLGEACRYDGKSLPNAEILALKEKYNIISVCPEVLGGLPTPRTPSERRGDRVIMRDGKDVTENFERGAKEAVNSYKKFSCAAAILKERSPSCGSGKIYDGSFSERLTDGDGVAAERLKEIGATVLGESEIGKLQKILDKIIY